MISVIPEPASLYPPANAKPTKVALYARVSLEKEDREDPRFQDPENQLVPLRRFAIEQLHMVHAEYADKISGASRSRPKLNRLLADARAHRFSLVLAVKVDRLSRSVSDLYSILEQLEKSHVKVHFIDQPNVSTDTPEGEAMLGMLGVFAQFERSSISSRTKAGIAVYRSRNERWGRPREKADLKEIASLRAQELSIREISRRLEVSEPTVRRRLRECVKKGIPICARETRMSEGGIN
jgi:DNA invertase Pin-like site-specific DNA recombinase